MKIKIWAASDKNTPNTGPFVAIDVVEKGTPYELGEMTYYGEIIKIPPSIAPFDEGVDQSVIVKMNPASGTTGPDNSAIDHPPSSYNKIQFSPIMADTRGYLSDDPPLTGTHTVLAAENLTIEDVSKLIGPDTFSLWTKDCYVTKDTVADLQNMNYAIVHRYKSLVTRDSEREAYSTELINLTVACLSLIRPTRKHHAMNVRGTIASDGGFQPDGFGAAHDLADVPEIQKLFTIRQRDIDLLSSILPEFIQLYKRDSKGAMKEEYEPLRMAVQLYEQAYALSYWKARHILWWSAIEALYGNNEDATTARIYAFFGEKKLSDGYRCSIYEADDIPSCYTPTLDSLRTLGKMVPVLYKVRNAAAHGQKVPDAHFVAVAHPFGSSVVEIDALAESATFIIRKTIIEILRRGVRDNFKDRKAREDFWLYQYGLDKHQSRKRLNELDEELKESITR